jgi:hypothetical protein
LNDASDRYIAQQARRWVRRGHIVTATRGSSLTSAEASFGISPPDF